MIIDKNIHIRNVKIEQFRNKSQIDEKIAISKEFIISEDESYIVIIFNKETFKGDKIYYCNGIPIYGKCIVIHRKGDVYKKIRLKV